MTSQAPCPALSLQGVTLRRGAQTILHGIDLALAPCEFVGLLGTNGAGKTTLMHAILGLVPIAAGQLRVLGSAPRRGNPAIGYLPQTRTPPGLRHLSGRDFVAGAIGGHRWGLPLLNAADRRSLDQALDLAGARHLADRLVGQLSGGQRQLLLLAQAIIGRPRLLLLDEPLTSLDPNRQRQVVETVRRIQQELQITVLFSAHDINPLLGALDRVLYLGGGHAAIGTVADVINGPVLSRLYGAPIDVVTLRGRLFVLSAESTATCGPHHHQAAHADA